MQYISISKFSASVRLTVLCGAHLCENGRVDELLAHIRGDMRTVLTILSPSRHQCLPDRPLGLWSSDSIGLARLNMDISLGLERLYRRLT